MSQGEEEEGGNEASLSLPCGRQKASHEIQAKKASHEIQAKEYQPSCPLAIKSTS